MCNLIIYITALCFYPCKQKEKHQTQITATLFSSFYVITKKEVNIQESKNLKMEQIKKRKENEKDKNTALKFENLQCCAKRQRCFVYMIEQAFGFSSLNMVT
ncbi:hypothetical protein V8G54_002024 [Vigna mungo]|uniref:Uncharacterized protein n=1 Tax=Vigna mungo TaxID=3915 RepID=A0AAQ3P9D4_VIGMU